MILVDTEIFPRQLKKDLFANRLYYNGDSTLPAIQDILYVLRQYTGKQIAILPEAPSEDGIHIIAQPLGNKDGQQFEIEVIADKATLWYSDYVGENNSLNNAVYYFLRQLGVYWLSSNANGLQIPFLIKPPTIYHQTVAFAIINRYEFGTGGNIARIPGSGPGGIASIEYSLNGLTYEQNWINRNRRFMISGDHYTSSHNGGAFYIANKALCDAHPEWFSDYTYETGGQTIQPGKISGRIKIEIPAAVEAWVNWVTSYYSAGSNTFKTIQTDPEDGRGGVDDALPPDGFAGIIGWNHADKWMWLANRVAEQFDENDEHIKISIQSYGDGNTAALAPKFPMRKNVIVTENAWSFQLAYIPRQAMFPAWADRITGSASAYDYLNITQWSQGLPQLANALADFVWKVSIYINNKVNGVIWESTDSNLLSPIYWVFSELMRNPAQNVYALWDLYFECYFGKAKAPMLRMYNRWLQAYQGLADVQFSLRDVKEAADLVPRNSLRWRRVMDYAAYIHYTKLYHTIADKSTIYNYLYQINHLQMVQTPGFLSQAYLGVPTSGDGVVPMSYADIETQLTDDIADMPVLYEVAPFSLDRRKAVLLQHVNSWWYRTGIVPSASFLSVGSTVKFDVGTRMDNPARTFRVYCDVSIVLEDTVTDANYDYTENASNGTPYKFKSYTLLTQPGKEYTISEPDAVKMITDEILWVTSYNNGFDNYAYPAKYIWIPEGVTEIIFEAYKVAGPSAHTWDNTYTAATSVLKSGVGEYDIYRAVVPVEHRGKCWKLNFNADHGVVLNLPNVCALQPFNYNG